MASAPFPKDILFLYLPAGNLVHSGAMSPFRFSTFLFVLPLFHVSLFAQGDESGNDLLPVEAVPLPVDMIQPVPAPEIAIGEISMDQSLPEDLKIDNQGGTIEGNLEDGIRFGGPVKVTGDNGLEIFSQRATVDLKAKSVTFEGRVSIYQGNTLQRGDSAVYFYETRELDASGLRISLDPILLEAGKFTGSVVDGKQVFVGEDAGVTTHDVEHPNFWVRSKKTTVYPGDRVTFQNMRLYAGDTPIFWLPYLSQPLDSKLGYHFVPGGRTNWGAFLLNSYGIMLGGTPNELTGEKEDAWLLSQWRLDLRSKRGVAVGLDLEDIREEDSSEITGLKLYFLHDLNPEDTRNGIPRTSIDPNRYEAQLKNRVELDLEQDADWRLDTNLTLLSDQYYLEDFDPRVYSTDPAPDNTVGIYRRDEKSLLSLFGRFRLNDFYRADTQLPQIALDQVRGPFFGLPLQHEGQTSFSVRGEQAGDESRRNILDPVLSLPPGDPRIPGLLAQLNRYERGLVNQILSSPPGSLQNEALRAQLYETGFNRFHTNHAFSLPLTYGNWFTITPQGGLAYTNYSSVKGPYGSDSRFMAYGGTEASVKFSKDYGNDYNSYLGLDGLLHIIQPYANWSVLSVDELPEDYPKIDRLTFTTRPRPLDPSRYTAIDQFNSWNILRFGVRNQLLTRRDGQSQMWLIAESYIDRYMDDPEGNRDWSNFYNDLRWQPLPWLGIDFESQIPVVDAGSGFSEFSTRARFMPYENMEVSLAYRFLNNHPFLLDSDRVDLGVYLRLSENWGAGTRQVFEADDGVLEFQEYTLHRDLGNWVAGVGITHRDNRLKDEFGIVFSLTLKNFPSASLPFSLSAE